MLQISITNISSQWEFIFPCIQNEVWHQIQYKLKTDYFIPVWRQTRPSITFTYVISRPLVQVGMFQGDSNVIFLVFYTSLCVKPVVEIILAFVFFSRPEYYSTLGLYFLFLFLNGRHSVLAQNLMLNRSHVKNMWLSFAPYRLDMLAVSSRYLSSLVTHA